MTNFAKAPDDGAGFKYLCTKFPALSTAKLREGVFVGPDIRKRIKDHNVDVALTDPELRAWEAFKAVCSNFLRNHKANIIETMLKALKRIKILTAICH